MKKMMQRMTRRIITVMLLMVMMCGELVSVQAAMPSLSSSCYMKTYPLSTGNNTPVFTSSSLNKRGTASPYKEYSATIYASDEIYVYSMNSTWAYVSYPTSSGRSYGYIATSSITQNNNSQAVVTSSGRFTTYKRASANASAGYVAKGDKVYTIASNGNWKQIIYESGSNWRMAWCSNSDYSRYVSSSNTNGVLSGEFVITTALSSALAVDIHNNENRDGANVQVYQKSDGNLAQIYTIEFIGNGYYRIIHKASGKVLDVAGGVAANAVNVQLYTWNGTAAQLWTFIDAGNGYYYIKNKLGYYLDLSYAIPQNNQNIWVHEFNGSDAQKWKLTSIQQSTNTTTTIDSTEMSFALYKSSGRLTCGFDGYKTVQGMHEGIDFAKGYGSAVYSLTDGVVIRVTEGSNGSDGLSTIAIYSETTGKTVIYLHTNPEDTLKIGQTIAKGDLIATEAWRGCSKKSDTHTHVEVRNGRRESAAISKDYTLENENPTSFWNSQGYVVK